MSTEETEAGGVQYEDAAPEVLAAEAVAELAAAKPEIAPCVPVKRADGLPDCGASNCDFMGGRTACRRQQ